MFNKKLQVQKVLSSNIHSRWNWALAVGEQRGPTATGIALNIFSIFQFITSSLSPGQRFIVEW